MKTRGPLFWRTWSVAILIFIGGSIPGERLDDFIDSLSVLEKILSDRTLHFLAFAGFASLLGFDYRAAGRFRTPCLRILAFAAGFGFLLELWQALLPYRTFQIHDLLFDLLGGLAGLLLCQVFLFLQRKRL